MSDECLFIDTNIIMYAASKEHKYKNACARIISMIADGSFYKNVGNPVTDTEVFQEIFYHYSLVERWKRGVLICKHFLALGPEVLPFDSSGVEKMLKLTKVVESRPEIWFMSQS